jgi:hypothetical protein
MIGLWSALLIATIFGFIFGLALACLIFSESACDEEPPNPAGPPRVPRC